MYRSSDYDYHDYTKTDNKQIPLSGTLRGLVKKLQKMYPHDTHISFALQGVRTNGYLATTGLIDILNDAIAEQECQLESVEKSRKALSKAQVVEQLIRDAVVICPECKGHKGEQWGPNAWTDCSACDGQGVLLKIKDQ